MSTCRATSWVRFISATAASTTGGTSHPTISPGQALRFRAHLRASLGQLRNRGVGDVPDHHPDTAADEVGRAARTGVARVAASPTTAAPAPITTSETCALSLRR